MDIISKTSLIKQYFYKRCVETLNKGGLVGRVARFLVNYVNPVLTYSGVDGSAERPISR